MPLQHEEHVCFRLLSDSSPPASSRIFIVLLHQLACRGSLRQLERVLKKFALRPSERLIVVLGVVNTCPKAVCKGAARAAARHVVIYHSVDHPIAAAAHALADIDLRVDDFVIVLRDVRQHGRPPATSASAKKSRA